MSAEHKRAWLITDFAPQQIVTNYSSILPSDVIIAVDGGLKRCLELHLSPDVLIGDFDSVETSNLLRLKPSCQRITYPRIKDETDTQLAVQYCIQEEYREIIICNDLGGRFDHSLALIQNLMQAQQNGLKASIISSTQMMFVPVNEAKTSYRVNSLLSIIALSETVEFVSSQGLKFPLNDVTLYNWQSRGISNVVTEPKQEIRFKQGQALIIVTPK